MTESEEPTMTITVQRREGGPLQLNGLGQLRNWAEGGHGLSDFSKIVCCWPANNKTTGTRRHSEHVTIKRTATETCITVQPHAQFLNSLRGAVAWLVSQ